MTAQQELVDWLTKHGVEHEIRLDEQLTKVVWVDKDNPDPALDCESTTSCQSGTGKHRHFHYYKVTEVVIEAGTAKVDGYTGFVTSFNFDDDDGSLHDIGIWE